MPAWMEILINVIGYAGFVAIATYQAITCRTVERRTVGLQFA